MKVDTKTLTNMEEDIRVIIKFFNLNPIDLNVNDLNDVWLHVFMNRNYPDNNPNVKKDNEGKRILSQIEDFELYPCDTNDTTIYTALNKILDNLKNNRS
jgi:hypothetical protein